MTRFITHAVFNGTKLMLSIPGKDIDSCMKRLRKMRDVRNATLFVFYNRKTQKLVDARMN